jgi:hypothetical protein
MARRGESLFSLELERQGLTGPLITEDLESDSDIAPQGIPITSRFAHTITGSLYSLASP